MSGTWPDLRRGALRPSRPPARQGAIHGGCPPARGPGRRDALHAAFRAALWAAALSCLPADARAEILIRWEQDRMPAPQSLGIGTLVVPAGNEAAVRHALALGYRLYLEVDAPAIAAFSPPPAGVAGIVIRGDAPPGAIEAAARRLAPSGIRVISLDARGKWPHIRTNWVTRNGDVLQVTARSAQPWIENNAALQRIARAAGPTRPSALTYSWAPSTQAESDEGPALEHYLVAIAEAGSFGGDLVLPLHPRLQTGLVLGRPEARAAWTAIRRSLEFYSWDLPARYVPIANIAVVTADPMRWYEVMNLLLRHNLPFELMTPAELPSRDLSAMDLVICLDDLPAAPREAIETFARAGGTVMAIPHDGSTPRDRDEAPLLRTGERVTHRLGAGTFIEVLQGIPDPDAFALEVRQIVGPDRRTLDIWNGITVLAASFTEPTTGGVLVTVLNYAHQPLPVQLRVSGTFSAVHYETPEEAMALLPHQHRHGHTEVVIPALTAGGRLFLTK